MKIIIEGQTPAQKNNKQIAINRKTGKTFIVSNKNVQAWQKSAALQLTQYKQRFTDKVTVSYYFYVKDNRARDLDNMEATVNDALVKAGIVLDDSWQCLAKGGSDAEIDRDNPRAVIEIVPYGV